MDAPNKPKQTLIDVDLDGVRALAKRLAEEWVGMTPKAKVKAIKSDKDKEGDQGQAAAVASMILDSEWIDGVFITALRYVMFKDLRVVETTDAADSAACMAALRKRLNGGKDGKGPPKLGDGAFGDVFEHPTKKNVVVKMLRIDNFVPEPPQDNLDEVEIAKIAGELGVGPKVRGVHRCCDPAGRCSVMIEQARLKETLRAWKERKSPKKAEKERVRDALKGHLAALKKAGIRYSDMHENNVMLDAKGRVYIIDYGYARFRKDKDDGARDPDEKDVMKYMMKWLFDEKYKASDYGRKGEAKRFSTFCRQRLEKVMVVR